MCLTAEYSALEELLARYKEATFYKLAEMRYRNDEQGMYVKVPTSTIQGATIHKVNNSIKPDMPMHLMYCFKGQRSHMTYIKHYINRCGTTIENMKLYIVKVKKEDIVMAGKSFDFTDGNTEEYLRADNVTVRRYSLFREIPINSLLNEISARINKEMAERNAHLEPGE